MAESTPGFLLQAQRRKLEQQFAARLISKEEYERRMAEIAATTIENNDDPWISYRDLSDFERSDMTGTEIDAMTAQFLQEQGVQIVD